MEYLERNLFDGVKKWIDRREIIAIKGPRQSGKTTLLEMIRRWLINSKKVKEENIVSVSFEDREILEKFSVDPRGFVERYIKNERIYLFLDEVHYCNELGHKLKLIYDSFRNVKLIITGSSSLELTSQTAKYLVGRIFSFELLPFSFYEFLLARDERLAKIYLDRKKEVRNFILRGKNLELRKDIHIKEISRYLEEYLIYGGYPEVIKTGNREEKQIILKNIYDTYVEKDILSYLQISDTLKFRKVVSLVSFSIGNILSYESLANNSASYYKEILKLIDVLEQTYVIKRLRPFYKNLVTELRKNPKVYFYDLGLRNYAINNFNTIGLRDDVGRIAENFVFSDLGYEGFSLNFWRTTGKAEVDFVISDVKEVIPIEVKFERMKKKKFGKSFYSFLDAYKPKRGVIVTRDYWGEMKIGKTNVKFIPIVYF